MKRSTLALAALVLSLSGFFALYALPWVGISGDSPQGSESAYLSYHELSVYAEAADFFRGFGGDDAAFNALVDMAGDLDLVFHALAWSAAASAVALAGHALRAWRPAWGDLLSMASAVAAALGVLLVLGHVLFLADLVDFAAELSRGQRAFWGINYASAAFGLGACLASGLHAWRGLPAAREALGDLQRAPAPLPPAPAAAPHAPPGSPAPPSAPAPHAGTLQRIGAARLHAQAIASHAPSDPAMAEWLRQMTAWLDALELRARGADPATLRAIEQDLERHVFSLRAGEHPA